MNSAATRLPKMTLVAAISFHYSMSHRQRMTCRSEHSNDRTAMRIFKFSPRCRVSPLRGGQATLAQNAENGRRLSERWCSECHAIGSASDKLHRAPSFASIAARDAINADMIASFLLLPHTTMPNPSVKPPGRPGYRPVYYRNEKVAAPMARRMQAMYINRNGQQEGLTAFAGRYRWQARPGRAA